MREDDGGETGVGFLIFFMCFFLVRFIVFVINIYLIMCVLGVTVTAAMFRGWRGRWPWPIVYRVSVS